MINERKRKKTPFKRRRGSKSVFQLSSNMIFLIFCFSALGFAAGLKTWIPNTNIDALANWDSFPWHEKCLKINLDVTSDLTMLWSLPKISATELSFPTDGNVLFEDTTISFTDKNKCDEVKTATYIRDELESWLNPYNWKSESDAWLPHVERIPCAGEDILFPPKRSFGVELPSILLPIGKITFEDQEYDGVEWVRYAYSLIGFEYFKNPWNIFTGTPLPWRNDVGCVRKKDCFCARSPYKIDYDYKDVSPKLLEEEVCEFARKKCESPKCMFPVIPDGHCCGICGAIIKLKDNTEYGIDLNVVKKKVNQELKNSDHEVTTYVGRTSDENIQIVFIAENPDDTFKTLSLANLVEEKLKGYNFQATLSAKYSGLPVSTYFFKGGLGIAIGTLLAVIALFLAIYYVYIILPKKRFGDFLQGKQFIFARFENTMNEASSEENLEIATASEALNETANKAFDNPMYSGESKATKTEPPLDINQTPKTQEEYSNPVYDELEKSELNIFENKENPVENVGSEDDQLNIFSEIKI